MQAASDVEAAAVPTRRPSPRWPVWVFRAVVAVHALLVFAQALFAGQFLSGNPAALGLHEANGTEVITLVALIQVIASVLLWRPGRGPWFPAVVSIAVAVAEGLQIVSGFEGQLALHVPLGVGVLVTLVAMLVGIRLPRR